MARINPDLMQVDSDGGIPSKNQMTQKEIDAATAAVIAAGGKSTDPANRLPGETASEANARITQGYKDQPKPELTKEGAAAGATIEWVRTGAGGVGEYKEVYPIGVPIPQTRTTAYGNTYDQQGNLVSGTGLKTTSGGASTGAGSSITGGGQWLDRNGQLRGNYGALLNAAVAAGMPVKLLNAFKKDYNLGTLEGQYQAIQDWAFQSGDSPELAGGKAFIELLGRDRIAKILQGDTSWNQGFTDNFGQPVAGSPMEGRPLFQPYTGKYESTELTDPSKTAGAGLKGKSLYSFDPKNPSAETNSYIFPNGFKGTNAEYRAQFGEDPNTILEVGSPEYIKLAQSGATGVATTTGQGYTQGTAKTTTLPFTQGTAGATTFPYTSGPSGVTGTPSNPYVPGTQQYADFNERKSAYDLLYQQFNQYGLAPLVTPLKDLITSGASPAEFTIKLRDTDAYKKRFAANAERIAKGLTAIPEAQYLGLEDQYQSIMRNYGLPETYYTRGDMGTQEGFNKFIANDVSAAELEDRILTAQQRVVNANPEVIASLKQFYPGITNGDILAYTLDPKTALTDIKRKVTAAEIGGGALQAGLSITGTRAEELGAAGITKQQAQQGFQTVADVAPRGGQLAAIYGESPYTQQTAEQEIFGLAGSTEAAKQRKKLVGLEKAAFSGQTGATQGALGRERAGNL